MAVVMARGTPLAFSLPPRAKQHIGDAFFALAALTGLGLRLAFDFGTPLARRCLRQRFYYCVNCPADVVRHKATPGALADRNPIQKGTAWGASDKHGVFKGDPSGRFFIIALPATFSVH